MAQLSLQYKASYFTAIAPIVDVVRAVEVDVVVEVQAVVAVDAILGTYATTVTCDVVVGIVLLGLVVGYSLWGI